MTLGLYNLRLAQLGLHGDELDELDEGDVYDMLAEMANDHEKWEELPTEENAFGVVV